MTALPPAHRRIRSRYGEEVLVRPMAPNDGPALCDMYDAYETKRSVQGLPAEHDETRRRWVLGMAEEPINVIATPVGSASQGKIVGHVCLFAMEPCTRVELLILIHQDWRNRGLGSALLGLAIDLAREARYECIWLVVSLRNTRAIRVYQKHCFEVCGHVGREIEMLLPLR